MGLMCSLRGHDWSERELEDERDERGNEVVLTVREYEVCPRCDARNLVSENTEVTTVAGTEDEASEDGANEAEEAVAEQASSEPTDEPDDDAVDEAIEDTVDAADEDAAVEGDDDAIIVDAEDTAAADGETDVADEDTETPTEPAAAESGAVDPADEDAVVMTGDDDEPAVDAGADDAGAPETAADTPETTADTPETAADSAAEPADPHEDPATDDGVILPGEEGPSTDDDERGHGEWPEHEQAAGPESDEAKAWPEHEGEDGGYDAQSPDDEAADVEFGGGLAPETGEDGDAEGEIVEPDEGHDAEFVGDAVGRAPDRERTEQGSSRPTDGESVTGITSAGEVTAPSEGTSTSPDAQLVCPACGNAERRSRTSLRAGDICPECKRGYLAEADE
jgi:hypothetical protein